MHGQLKYFDETMLKLKRQKSSAVDVANVFTQLKLNLYLQKIRHLGLTPSKASFGKPWERKESRRCKGVCQGN